MSPDETLQPADRMVAAIGDGDLDRSIRVLEYLDPVGVAALVPSP